MDTLRQAAQQAPEAAKLSATGALKALETAGKLLPSATRLATEMDTLLTALGKLFGI